MNALRARIAAVLGWSAADTLRFSLPTLREFIREKDPALFAEVSAVIRSGYHIYGSKKDD